MALTRIRNKRENRNVREMTDPIFISVLNFYLPIPAGIYFRVGIDVQVNCKNKICKAFKKKEAVSMQRQPLF